MLKSKGGEVVTACIGDDCCDPDEMPTDEELAARETPCNTCGYRMVSYYCNESTGKWEWLDTGCSVSKSQIEERCYDWKWKEFSSASCVYDRAGVYPNTHISGAYCFIGQGLYEINGASTIPYGVNNSCGSSLREIASMLFDTEVTYPGWFSVPSSCSAADKDKIAYLHDQDVGHPGTFGCTAFRCEGTLKSN